MSMDLNTLRTVVEVLCFAGFVGIVAWAYSARRRDDFDSAAAIPFDHE
jgi:cytochrome c oxidase cbb3-type subunit 4